MTVMFTCIEILLSQLLSNADSQYKGVGDQIIMRSVLLDKCIVNVCCKYLCSDAFIEILLCIEKKLFQF
jgi:hypothetical protein